MKVLFFGTPAVAVQFLQWALIHEEVVGVVCRPDEPVGRGYAVSAPPVKEEALKAGVPVFQPEGPWSAETVDALKNTQADVGLVVAYGRILPEAVFLAPRLGCVNIHFSLLPKYRGAAPIQWALIRGERRTGVSAFWLEQGLDSGPLLAQAPVDIEASDNVLTLRDRLAQEGVALMDAAFKELRAGRINRRPQEGEVTLAPPLKKEDGRLDWNRSARAIVDLIRGVMEWPGAVTHFSLPGRSPKQLKVIKAAVHEELPRKIPGEIVDVKNGLGPVVQTGDGGVLLLEVQLEGKRPMPAWAFWQGAHLKTGDRFG